MEEAGNPAGARLYSIADFRPKLFKTIIEKNMNFKEKGCLFLTIMFFY